MESTGMYWIILCLVLEESGFQLVLVNACQVKGIPEKNRLNRLGVVSASA
ncbi:MAG: hypothetical protein LBE76_09255 [Nitrososphaerota archaeon]|jgi:transposase|nr:hypothetical protein [Nitrososphaerota archaeon]